MRDFEFVGFYDSCIIIDLLIYLIITVSKQVIMSNFYDQLCETFIRPSRQVYNAYDLGKTNFSIGQPMNKNGKRTDFHVYNNRQQKIMCSFFSNSR